MGKEESLYNIHRNINWFNHCVKHWGILKRTKIGTTKIPTNHTSGRTYERKNHHLKETYSLLCSWQPQNRQNMKNSKYP